MKKKVSFAAMTALLSAVPASWGEEKVTICHVPPGNPANVQIITIGESAVAHHFSNHVGDGYPGIGRCGTGGNTGDVSNPQ